MVHKTAPSLGIGSFGPNTQAVFEGVAGSIFLLQLWAGLFNLAFLGQIQQPTQLAQRQATAWSPFWRGAPVSQQESAEIQADRRYTFNFTVPVSIPSDSPLLSLSGLSSARSDAVRAHLRGSRRYGSPRSADWREETMNCGGEGGVHALAIYRCEIAGIAGKVQAELSNGSSWGLELQFSGELEGQRGLAFVREQMRVLEADLHPCLALKGAERLFFELREIPAEEPKAKEAEADGGRSPRLWEAQLPFIGIDI